MSSEASRESITINIYLTNFQGLQYDNDLDTSKFEVSLAYISNIIGSETLLFDSNELFFQITINPENENDLFNLFLNPLLLTLVRHDEDEISSTIGYCSVDLLPLFSTKTEIIEHHKYFEAGEFMRKISFDVKISTEFPLLDAEYENFLLFTLDSIYNVGDVESVKIGMKVPYQDEFDKDVIFDINLKDQPLKCSNKSKQWFNLYQVTGNASNSIYFNECYKFPLQDNEIYLLELFEHRQTKINAVFRTLLMTQEAKHAFYYQIRKLNKIIIEVILNGTDHFFGFVNCEELLHVGRKRLKTVVELQRFELETFKNYSQFESIFHKSLQNATKQRKSSRKGSKVQANLPNTLEQLRATDEDGCQIFMVVEMEFEKALNEDTCGDDDPNIQDVAESTSNCEFTEDLRKELLQSARKLLQKYEGCTLKEVIERARMNGDFLAIESFLAPKMELVRRQLITSDDDETFLCHVTSQIINPKVSQVDKFNQSMQLTKIYEALGSSEKAQDIYLSELLDNKNSSKLWLQFAIFNARREHFDMLQVSLNELLKIDENSVIGNILKAYLLFKTRKFRECLSIIDKLKSLYGCIEEVNAMKVLVNQIIGHEVKFNGSTSITHESIESIYSSTELLWCAARDERLLSWQNSFIKCAIFYIKIGCYDIAELCLGEYYQNCGININYMYLLSVIDTLRGTYKEALIHLKKIPENDTVNHNLNYSQIISSIVLNLLHEKNFVKAKELFDTYIHIQSCDNFLILLLFGTHFNDTNEFVIAKEFLIRAANTFQCHIVLKELGRCLKNLQIFDLAEESLMAAIKLDANDTESWMSLKEIYEIQARHEASKFCYLNACNLKE